MRKEFIPYEQALALKELGFDGLCIATVDQIECLHIKGTKSSPRASMMYDIIDCPLYQQAFRWFREKYNLNSFVIDSKSYNWYFNINDMVKDNVISEVLYFKNYEESELECLKKLIEIVKSKS